MCLRPPPLFSRRAANSLFHLQDGDGVTQHNKAGAHWRRRDIELVKEKTGGGGDTTPAEKRATQASKFFGEPPSLERARPEPLSFMNI